MRHTARHTITLKDKRAFTFRLVKPKEEKTLRFAQGDISFEIGFRFRRPVAGRSIVSWNTPYGTLHTRPASIRYA